MDANQPGPSGPRAGSGVILGTVLLGFLVSAGVLNLLAAAGAWNPFGLRRSAWSGALMIAAPLSLLAVTSLPARVKARIPDGAAVALTLAVWIALAVAVLGAR